jgi:peptide/nickel transport system substrate-binding protein
VDRYTIVFKTARPYAMVPYDLNSVFIVSRRAARRAATEDFNSGRAAVGTGPYRVARFARGDRVELVRHDAYRDGRPAWDRVTFRMVPNSAARTAALLAGDVDVIEQIPSADVVKLRTNPSVHLEQKVSWRTIFFHLEQGLDRVSSMTDADGRPLARNPLKDVRVRRAISQAINRQAIVERVMEGLAVPAANLVSPGVFGHVADLKPDAYDPEGAKRLLADAGFTKGFGITVHAPNDRYVNDDRIAQAVAQMLARVGIRARVTTLPFSVYVSKARNREFGFAMLGWGSYSGDLALRSLVATFDATKGYGTWNWGRYSDPAVDALVERSLATVDPAAREPIAQEAMRAAMQARAVIPLHHQVATWAMRKDLAYTGRTDEYTLAHHVRLR